MPLARLENFLKNLNGNTLYVDPSELDSSDSIENRGNSRLRPFKTIQRALLEAARFSYIPGAGNDLFDQTTILIAPGTHFLDNRPGFYVNESNVLKDVNGASRNISEFNISSNFDLEDPSNVLYIFNAANGGIIVPRGTSIVATDLRKTKIRPKFVPNPVDDLIEPASLFQLTGACYIYGFTVFDGDPIGKVYSNYTTNRVVPNYSHHKLTAFEYADGNNNLFRNGVDTGHNDLDNYYYKLALAYGSQSGRSIIDGFSNFQPSVDENRIVGELGVGSIVITSAICGDGAIGTNVITIETSTPHGLSPFTPILISGLGQAQGPVSELEYNGNYVVAQVTSEYEFTYLVSGVPTETLNPSVTGAIVKVISDTVSSASPYVFNCSLKSVYGMNGLHADGSKATGFKSMVTAQFTGISLQKDDRAFCEYDDVSGAYKFQDNFGVDKFLHQSSISRYRPSWETFHIKASNDSFIQCVSIFAIGYAKQFVAETGGDQSITNSNSNFGSISLCSSGYKSDTLAKDNYGFITHVIPPKDISLAETDIRYFQLDGVKTTSLRASNQSTRVYINGYTDFLDPPPLAVRSYALGGRREDKIYFKRANLEYGIPINPAYDIEPIITTIDPTTNIVTLSSVSGISTGFSGKIIAKNGVLPDGIEFNKLYYVRMTGGNGIKLYDNLLNAETDTAVIDIKNTVGLTTSNLTFRSRISEKSSGDAGAPIQWDSTNSQWYVGVNSVGAGATDFFINLAAVNTPSAFAKRRIDSRLNNDKLYRVRLVVPKESQNASQPTSGFIIQKASNALNSLFSQGEAVQLVSATGQEVEQVRNKGSIVDAWYTAGTQTATVVTSKPHNLKVGNKVNIYALKSSAEPAPVGLGTGTGFNGKFEVTNVVNELIFEYSLIRNPGTITQGTSSFASWLTVRNCAQTSSFRVPPYTVYDSNRDDLPYFVCKEIENDYQIYNIETTQDYVYNTSDGIYYITLNLFKNIPDVSPFNVEGYKLSQSVENLYPILDLDNPNPDPEHTVTIPSRDVVGSVIVSDLLESTSKETIVNYFKDFDLGKKITGITTYNDAGIGICTATTATNHGLGGIRRLNITAAGSGLVDGSYYDIPLCGGTGSNATANVTVSGNIATQVSIANPGSGYVIGDVLELKGTPGSVSYVNVSVNSLIFDSTDTDTIQILGATNKGNNGAFIIKSVTANTITYYNNNAVVEANTSEAVAVLSGVGYPLRTVPDGAVYNSSTDLTTVTVNSTTPHSFQSGSKVIFDDAINVTNVGICTVVTTTGVSTFTVRGDASSANRVYSVGLVPNLKDATTENENLVTRQFAVYTGYKSRTAQTISVTDQNFLVSNIFGLQKGDFIEVGPEIMMVTRVSGGEIYVRRALFGTRKVTHESGTSIKRINILPIELRRNSILRASGHTFEYTGFGPGNYSTGMPTNQTRILTNTEQLISQALATNGGLIVYTGMNSAGEFYIGRTKFDALTGRQTDVGIPVAESGDSAVVDILTVNKLIVNDETDAATASAIFNSLVVQTDVDITGVTTMRSTVSSISPDTGALIIEGGVGIAENLYVGVGAAVTSITLGISSVSQINTRDGRNLELDSTGGTVLVKDELNVSETLKVVGVSTFSDIRVTGIATITNQRVTGVSTFVGVSSFVSNISAGASITSVGDIVAGTGAKFKGYGTIPLGAIIMWSGSVASIPVGWSLCNGTNGTPDLRERFVIGAGGDNSTVAGTTGYNPGDTGGANTVTLDTTQIPAHNHPATSTSTTTITGGSGTFLTGASLSLSTGNNGSQGPASSVVTGGSISTSNGSVTTSASTTTTTTTTTSNTGGGLAHENRPPYYALAFIMRTT